LQEEGGMFVSSFMVQEHFDENQVFRKVWKQETLRRNLQLADIHRH
jgi:hypothetical protein